MTLILPTVLILHFLQLFRESQYCQQLLQLMGEVPKGLPVMSFVKTLMMTSGQRTIPIMIRKEELLAVTLLIIWEDIPTQNPNWILRGLLLQTITTHLRKAGETGITVKERFVYDNGNRLKEHYHRVDSNPEELLAKTVIMNSQLVNKAGRKQPSEY